MADNLHKKKLIALPFSGTMNTVKVKGAFKTGEFSDIKNIRDSGDGFQQRLGQKRLHTTTDKSAHDGQNVYQFKDKAGTKHTYVQWSDGTVHKATNNPPTGTTGNFGSAVATAIASSLPATWSELDDNLLFSDGVRQHQIFTGDKQEVLAFVVYKGSSSISDAVLTGSGLDDATAAGTYTGTPARRYYKVKITTASGTDKFDWSYRNFLEDSWTSGATNVDVTGSAQTLDNGVTITLVATTGHTLNDYWIFWADGIPIIPEVGEDYTPQIGDASTSRVATLSSLNTLANMNVAYIITSVPCVKLNFTMQNANGTTSATTLKYWNGAYTAVGGFNDGTDSTGTETGATFGQLGSMTWNRPSDEIPHTQFGITGFVYQISVSIQLDSSTTVSRLTYSSSHSSITSDYQNMVNVWDGFPTTSIQAQVYNSSSIEYEVYGGGVVPLVNIFGDTNDYVYFNSLDRLWAVYMSVGATPNIVKASIASSTDISIHDSGSDDTDDYIQRTQGDFIVEGFEVGMSIVLVTNSGTNDGTYTITRMSSNRLYLGPNAVTSDETATTAGASTITYNQAPVWIDTLQFWDSNSWVDANNLTDGTRGLTRSGYVTFDRTTGAHKSQFNQSVGYTYWYRFRCDKKTSASVTVSIAGCPYYDIYDLGIYGRTNAVWKGRPVVSFNRYPSFLYIGATNKPMTFNGVDFAPVQAGDGRSNAVLVALKFKNELMVWQEEIGMAGGCVTLLEGYSPTGYGEFGTILLNDKIGIVNSKSAVVVDGVYTSTKTDEDIKTLAYFISRYGIMACDGKNVTVISDDIQNYFDPTQSECIRVDYESQHFMSYDSTYGILRIGLCSGSTATKANVFLRYDIAKKHFSFDTPGVYVSSMTEVDASTGAVEVLQIAGGQDGFIHMTNTGTDDYSSNGTAAITTGVPLVFATTTTITRASGSFSSDGWVAGMGIRITGSANNDTSDGTIERVTTVAATTLTFSGATFTVTATATGIVLTNKLAIDFQCTKEINGEGYKVDIKGSYVIQKVQGAGDIIIDISRDGNISFDTNLTRRRTMTAPRSGETISRVKIVDNQQAGNFSIRFRNNTVSQAPHLISSVWDSDIKDVY